MRSKNRITNLKAARKSLAMIVLLVLSIILPVMSFSSGTTLHFESTPIQFEPSAETPDFNLSYTSRTNLIATPVESGDTIGGDHVILKAEWTPALINRSRLEIFAPAIPILLTLEEDEASLEIDTRALGNNATCTITSTAWLTNGSIMTSEFTDVYIGNYFVPKVKVLSPNGGESWTGIHNITWSVFDSNADDTFLFDVFYSSNSGQSFETLVTSTNLTWFEWDSTGLNQTDTYIVQIRVTDGIYFSTDRSDETFTAGTIIATTTTTTPTTTPTTTEPGLEPRIIAFVVILLFSSGVMALVVYYAARKWF
jgi:hypothetical protein